MILSKVAFTSCRHRHTDIRHTEAHTYTQKHTPTGTHTDTDTRTQTHTATHTNTRTCTTIHTETRTDPLRGTEDDIVCGQEGLGAS